MGLFLRALMTMFAVATAGAAVAATTLADAIKQANVLDAHMKFAEVIQVLGPYADSGNANVEFELANAYMNIAINGHSPVGAAPLDGEIASVVGQSQPNPINPASIRPAIGFAQRAASHGDAGADNLLYMIYANGFGVPVDGKMAIEYLKRGVKGGDQGAKLNYAIMLYEGSPIVTRDVTEACRLFDDLVRADPSDVLLAYYLGQVIYRGQCGKRADKIRGMKLIEAAAEHGVRNAARDMGESSEYGWIGPPDVHAALHWYEVAAADGDPWSQWRIGMAYVNGEFGAKDSVKGVHYLQESAASNDPNGLTDLGVMYVEGDGVAKDFGKAKALYERAAALGSPHAYRELAAMYVNGEGVSVDRMRARVLYLQSVALGEQDSESIRKVIESGLSAEQMKQSDQEFAQWQRTRAH